MKSALDLIEIAEIQFVFVRFPVLLFDATFRSKKSWLLLKFALERQALIWLVKPLLVKAPIWILQHFVSRKQDLF